MKLALSWFCILYLASVNAGLFSRHDLRAPNRNPSARAPVQHGTGASSSSSRQRPLFARRGQYERQRIHVPKPKLVPVPPKDPPRPPKVPPKPVKPSCSELTQSCLPQSGCCDPCASCHCRFFNTICYCRRTGSVHEKKT